MPDGSTRDFEGWETLQTTPWYSMLRQDDWHAVTITGGLGAAALLVLDSLGRVLLLRVFRVPLDRVCLEIPRGFAKTQEAPADCARREFTEETGLALRSDQMIHLGSVFPDSGILANHIELFAARLDRPFPEHIPFDRKEVVGYQVVEAEELLRMIADGRVSDAFTIAATLRLATRQARTLQDLASALKY
jgi:ADP-ribose pyrophosphatase